jgi:hypothetical protein
MSSANLLLRGARVTPDFRDALYDAANRAGMSVNEFVISAAAEKLVSRGAAFRGVFRPGDFDLTARAA